MTDLLAILDRNLCPYTRRATVLRVEQRKLAEKRRGTRYAENHKQAISEGLKRAWAEGRRPKPTWLKGTRRCDKRMAVVV